MKKIVFAVVVLAAVLFASCSLDGGEDILGTVAVDFSLPDGIYIAGRFDNGGEDQPCYWVGNKQVTLDGDYIKSISVSDGKVLAFGYFTTPEVHPVYGTVTESSMYCYWIDGTRTEIPGFFGFRAKVVLDNEKIYLFDGDDSVWENGTKIQYDEDFEPYSIAVNNGKLYAVGAYYWGIRNRSTSYYTDKVRKDIFNSGFYFYPYDMTVSKDGKVYIVGSYYFGDTEKYGYYADGQFFELQYDDEDDSIFLPRITVSDGKVYIFSSFFNANKYIYWEDGKRIEITMPQHNFVEDITVSRGKVYMAGRYWRGNQVIACYWVDGVRYDLPSGYEATAIFVEE